ncbi:BlaI/MecI/CopY family transcriptional regulator [Clostridium estertheticum]|uniref:BlaI/MecI/CopY family transcriptional regulator n=1 Tax=Clostridium estertheticum TaxID=238834 RepID=A0A5N7IJ03_9CLOT|nr:BlaI/MecI/CopY family transcriptional regulator [Clostridium estertheticum]MBW9173816.1 BlaI/MecI/CopY family transcriptional regulator [Clostridium estertheticum]MBX4270977.1 BlaI/MecI/CopY family transcriptional regulator [Clostridium estertheticum]MCB2338760.1 BlaI/MecI/CopY family transcriptional regulator [Clostridium estertheticum]MPQ30283.1 BlaI/MecI/CopY family transcriptional regulator [Clostridium estertheticum]MPQ60959.1 BlaI/MecI/CopY family transcriptional regulator [Clostridiu
MYKMSKISNAEWEIMKIIWKNSEISSINIIKELKDKSEWKPATVKSLINRLLNKNIIGFNKLGYEYLYYPLVSEDDCIKLESFSFVNRVFNGSIKSMLLTFAQSDELSKLDIKDLKDILNQLIKRKCGED